MPMTTTQRFQIGDRVIHPTKPEWGVGIIATTAMTDHEGAPCQRLTIRFDRAGLKTISTAFANLKPATDAPNSPVSTHETPKASANDAISPLADADEKQVLRIMTALPDNATDPFASPADRLRATLALYRFEPTGGSLIDWAAAQSALADPLSRFNRHQLEEFFHTFARNLDTHLSKLVRQANTVEQSELVQIAQSAPPAGQRALQRLHRPR